MADISPAHPNDPASVMRQLRLSVLTTSPASFKATPAPQFPRIFAVVIDWPIDQNIASIVSAATGDASLYTTSTFGIIGGIGHETVRNAAMKLVSAADVFFDDSQPTTDFSYPDAKHIRFFFVTYNGVRVITGDYDSIYTGKDKLSPLFGLAQNVLTQLRLSTPQK